ncbi:MAG: hypothetical protein Q8P51_17595 [Ignavibacteria bacterium]|nr:hypothetical protein [Ignavibacteria bacterium]
MPGRSNQNIRFVAAIASTLVLQSQNVFADYTLSLKKSSGNTISIELSNADAIAGIQFSVNGRGGLTFGSYERTDRSEASGLEMYQYLKDDSTLNIVILALVRSALPSGVGSIGTVSFSLDKNGGGDTARIVLTRVVICNAEAQNLTVTAKELVWSTSGASAMQQARFTLEPNLPNPFNPSATIAYQLDKPANARLVVYDVTGRQRNILADRFQSSGRYSVPWNADKREGSMLASGMCFACLQVGDRVAVQKMISAQ